MDKPGFSYVECKKFELGIISAQHEYQPLSVETWDSSIHPGVVINMYAVWEQQGDSATTCPVCGVPYEASLNTEVQW